MFSTQMAASTTKVKGPWSLSSSSLPRITGRGQLRPRQSMMISLILGPFPYGGASLGKTPGNGESPPVPQGQSHPAPQGNAGGRGRQAQAVHDPSPYEHPQNGHKRVQVGLPGHDQLPHGAASQQNRPNAQEAHPQKVAYKIAVGHRPHQCRLKLPQQQVTHEGADEDAQESFQQMKIVEQEHVPEATRQA